MKKVPASRDSDHKPVELTDISGNSFQIKVTDDIKVVFLQMEPGVIFGNIKLREIWNILGGSLL